MTTYRCVYEIDLDADSPEAAALECLEMMSNFDLAPIIQVVAWKDDLGPAVVDGSMGQCIDLNNLELFDG